MHKYNVICDGLLALPTKGGKPVLFGFQMKECTLSSGEQWREKRLIHFNWCRTSTKPICDAYQFVHVLVEANMLVNHFESNPVTDPRIEEAFVSSVYTLEWSPMVAYSSCSARVFT